MLFFGSSAAHAFAIGDHRDITIAAFRELRSCGYIAATVGTDLDKQVARDNVDQDLDLFKKWFKYSHYYNPLKKLDMKRRDSSDSVREAQDVLLSSGMTSNEKLAALGRAMHHIQDANTPAHVTPINHWLEDGFENYSVAMPVISDHDELCANLARLSLALPKDLLELLETNALGTLAAIDDSVAIETTSSSAQSATTWRQGFWSQSGDNRFGRYGSYGNAFGSRKVPIQQTSFRDFKSARLRAAMDATEKVWLWFFAQVPN